MKKFISENWYKAIMALSFFILSCGVLIYAIRDNKAFAKPTSAESKGKTSCVGAFYDPNLNRICSVWSDGTVRLANLSN